MVKNFFGYLVHMIAIMLCIQVIIGLTNKSSINKRLCEVCSDVSQNANKCFFACVTNSRNIIPLFHKKVITHDPLQKIYPNLGRTCKNKFYENKIKLNWFNQLKKNYYVIIFSKALL